MRKPSQVERLYLDFDGFFAGVEQQERPELRGRPVGIVPITSAHTSLIAASREAKAHGVRGIVSVQEARRLIPDITLIEARPDVYVRYNRRIVELVDRTVPVLAVRSIDELVADVAGWSAAEIHQRALQIKTDLAREIGACVTCSIGVAANELLAKIAAELNKPDGLVTLPPEDLPGPLFDLNLRDIPGIAGGMARRLESAGIADMTSLWTLAPKHARAIWGGVEGERFLAQLHGYAIERAPTKKSMYGHSRVLARDWRSRDRAYACARLLVTKAARRMRREGYAASAFSLSVHGKHGEPGWFQEVQLQPAADDHAFLDCLDQAWPPNWPSWAKVVSVTLHGLSPAGSGMDDLFTTPTEAAERTRWLKIANTLDALNKRYGRAIVSQGQNVQPPGGYAGAKIAFGRIPDLEDF
jgi:DNA polymerase-4